MGQGEGGSLRQAFVAQGGGGEMAWQWHMASAWARSTKRKVPLVAKQSTASGMSSRGRAGQVGPGSAGRPRPVHLRGRRPVVTRT